MTRPIDIRDITPRDAVLGDKRLGLDSNDELAMTNQPDNSAIGTAASRDIGAAEDQIPLNSDLPTSAKSGDYNDLTNLPTLGTAAEKNTGTNPDQVPLNSDLGNSSKRDTGTATGQVLLSESAGLDGGETNWTSGNMQPDQAGGLLGRLYMQNVSGALIVPNQIVPSSSVSTALWDGAGNIGRTTLGQDGSYKYVGTFSLSDTIYGIFAKVA